VKAEEDAENFYLKLAALIKNALVKVKFESFAKEERRHRDMLIGYYNDLTGEKNGPPALPKTVKAAESDDVEFVPESIDKLFLIAIDREAEAAAFYRNAADKASDPTGKRMLAYLADFEDTHEEILKRELEIYKRDKYWYAEFPEIQLV